MLATNGVLVDETVVDRLVCNAGRGDAMMVVTWVDTWVEVCAVVTTVVWVCMLVWVVCTEVTAVEVMTLLDDGAPGTAGGGGGAGDATVDGGFSGGTTVSCAGMAGLRTIEFDGAVVVGKASAAFPLPSLPLPLPPPLPSPPLPFPCRRTNGGSTVSFTAVFAASANSARATFGLRRLL